MVMLQRIQLNAQIALLIVAVISASSAQAQESAADQVALLPKRHNFGLGIAAVGLSTGPAEKPAFGTALQLRYMHPKGTFSAGPILWSAVDERSVQADERMQRIGLFIEASYNVVRRGDYAFYVGPSVAVMYGDNLPKQQFRKEVNYRFITIGGNVGFAKRLGSRGAFNLQLEPSFGGNDTAFDMLYDRLGFIVLSKLGFFLIL